MSMDSPHFQSRPTQHRLRTTSGLSVHPSDNRGAIRKSTSSRSRSISTTQADRLHQFALQQQQQQKQQQQQQHQQPLQQQNASTPHVSSVLPVSAGTQWLTPQHSPQPHIYSEPALEPFQPWTVPTPPRSDSGVPTLSVDSNDERGGNVASSAEDFNFIPATTSAEMSSLGFLLPSQYGTSIYESEPSTYAMDQNYIPPMRMADQPASTSAPGYSHTLSSSPALYQSRNVPPSAPRRHSELPHPSASESIYSHNYRRTSNPYDSLSNQDYSVAPSQSIPSISGLTQSPMPSPNLNSSSNVGSVPHYSPGYQRSASMYDSSSMYGQSMSTAAPSSHMYASSHSMSYPPSFVGGTVNEVLAKPLGSESSIRVLNQRPKPQCFEHGCNGRQFSTFSNLLRHQREKSGTASKSYCPKCGAEFTRTTARNGHLAHDKCSKQQRRPSETGEHQ